MNSVRSDSDHVPVVLIETEKPSEKHVYTLKIRGGVKVEVRER